MEEIQHTLTLEGSREELALLGSNDRNIKRIREEFGIRVFARDGVGEPWSSVVEGGSKEDKLAAAQAGYLVRGFADAADLNDPEKSAKAAEELAGPAHFICSDFPHDVGEGYWFDLIGGEPSRCNPVTAPPECEAADIE